MRIGSDSQDLLSLSKSDDSNSFAPNGSLGAFPVKAPLVGSRQSRESGTPLADDAIQLAFERQASLTPNATALVMGDERMTYSELDKRSNQVARYLLGKGITAESLVVVCLERSCEMIVALLGILKAGAAYVPLDGSNPRERLAMILDDVRPAVVITEKRFFDSLSECGAERVCVEEIWSSISKESPRNLESLSVMANVAYVIYTSGSTGKPKGVMVTHGNVLHLLKATDPLFHFDENDVWSFFHSYAFDFSVWEIWGCLLTGGTLVIVPSDVTHSPEDFYDLLSREHVTVLNQTPIAFRQIIHLEESGYIKPLFLRYVIFGGEALAFGNLLPWFERRGDQMPQLVNMYGITETTVHVTFRPVTMADAKHETRSLIGGSIPDWNLYVLDADHRPVVIGAEGEMYVGGKGVARGYLNRPELTAERFVLDPFAGTPDARMYKSGDLARPLPNGDIEYLGRSDMQVKIHGFRIEVGEIEATLMQHAGVREAVVMVRTDGPGEKKLVAYAVLKTGFECAGANLREFLQQRLPAHMVPYAYVELTAIPLTANGKVDRSKLPAPNVVSSGAIAAAPATDLEQSVADIWRRVLRVDRIGLDDNFFDIGGDSLLLVSVQSSLQKLMSNRIPVTMLFDFTTIRSLARHLANSDSEAPKFADEQAQAQKQRDAFARARRRQTADAPLEEIS